MCVVQIYNGHFSVSRTIVLFVFFSLMMMAIALPIHLILTRFGKQKYWHYIVTTVVLGCIVEVTISSAPFRGDFAITGAVIATLSWLLFYGFREVPGGKNIGS